MELVSSILAIGALVVNKLINNHHADDKSIDALEERLANSTPHQSDSDNPN